MLLAMLPMMILAKTCRTTGTDGGKLMTLHADPSRHANSRTSAFAEHESL